MPTPLKTGEVLRGRYRIGRIIGQGGMGNIYLADDLRLEGRQCALKEVENDQSLPDELQRQAREQFFREASVLARLDHPNLPKVSDYFSISGCDYLVMDYTFPFSPRTISSPRETRTFSLEFPISAIPSITLHDVFARYPPL